MMLWMIFLKRTQWIWWTKPWPMPRTFVEKSVRHEAEQEATEEKKVKIVEKNTGKHKIKNASTCREARHGDYSLNSIWIIFVSKQIMYTSEIYIIYTSEINVYKTDESVELSNWNQSAIKQTKNINKSRPPTVSTIYVDRSTIMYHPHKSICYK